MVVTDNATDLLGVHELAPTMVELVGVVWVLKDQRAEAMMTAEALALGLVEDTVPIEVDDVVMWCQYITLTCPP